MALHDVADYTQRIIDAFPTPWANRTAFQPGGNLYAMIRAAAQEFVTRQGQIDYAALQTRIATATDTNLDTLAVDLLGQSYVRGTPLVGTSLLPEKDADFSARIRHDIIFPNNTLAAIQYRVIQYINLFYIASVVVNSRLLGFDTGGGLDTWGALDGRPSNLPPIPKVYVYDIQSDPVLATKTGLTAGQFCILFTYGGLKHDGFFIGHVHLGRASHVINPKIQIIPALTPALDVVVENAKAWGTKQIYADNRGP